jgi:transposase-like protein
MCESGINVDQLSRDIGRTEETLGMAQAWLEDLHHQADHGKQLEASAELAQVTVLLGEARTKLEKAQAALGGTSSPDVTVELV